MDISVNRFNVVSHGSINIPDADSILTFSENGLTINMNFIENVQQDDNHQDETIRPFMRFNLINEGNTLNITCCNMTTSSISDYSTGLLRVGNLDNLPLFLKFSIHLIGNQPGEKDMLMNYTWLTEIQNGTE